MATITWKQADGKAAPNAALVIAQAASVEFSVPVGILLGTDDMLEAVKAGRLIMDGAPEFGGQIGGFMLEVGALAK